METILEIRVLGILIDYVNRTILCGGYTEIPSDLRVIYEQKLVKMAFHQELVGKILGSSYVTCQKVVFVSYHKSVGGRSQVYNDGRALVGVLRLEFHADRHTTDMRGLSPSHISRKSLA